MRSWIAGNFSEAAHVHGDVKNAGRFWLILAAVSVLALAMDLGWRLYSGPIQSANLDRHVDFFAGHKTILGMFQVDCGRYPTTEEGLNALIGRPEKIPAADWRGPYFDPPQLPKDPWNHDYVYRCPGVHNTNGFDLFSFGADGVSKTGGEDADDINNWDSSSCQRGTFWTR